MSDIGQVADVLRNYTSLRRRPGAWGGGMAHPGLRLLRSVDLNRVAERILRRSRHNQKVASSMFKLAEDVIDSIMSGNFTCIIPAAVINYQPFHCVEPVHSPRQCRQRNADRFRFIQARYLNNKFHSLSICGNFRT